MVIRKSKIKANDILNFESPFPTESDLLIVVKEFYPNNKIIDISNNVYYINDLKRKYSKFSIMK